MTITTNYHHNYRHDHKYPNDTIATIITTITIITAITTITQPKQHPLTQLLLPHNLTPFYHPRCYPPPLPLAPSYLCERACCHPPPLLSLRHPPLTPLLNTHTLSHPLPFSHTSSPSNTTRSKSRSLLSAPFTPTSNPFYHPFATPPFICYPHHHYQITVKELAVSTEQQLAQAKIIADLETKVADTPSDTPHTSFDTSYTHTPSTHIHTPTHTPSVTHTYTLAIHPPLTHHDTTHTSSTHPPTHIHIHSQHILPSNTSYNTSYQHILSTHSINTTYQHTPYQHTPYQHTPCQHNTSYHQVATSDPLAHRVTISSQHPIITHHHVSPSCIPSPPPSCVPSLLYPLPPSSCLPLPPVGGYL